MEWPPFVSLSNFGEILKSGVPFLPGAYCFQPRLQVTKIYCYLDDFDFPLGNVKFDSEVGLCRVDQEKCQRPGVSQSHV